MNFWVRALLYFVGAFIGSVIGQAIIKTFSKSAMAVIAVIGVALMLWLFWEMYRRILVQQRFNNEDRDNLVAGFQRERRD